MTKMIKFNLVLDNNPIRGLDDLRNNFNIEDVLAAYRNGSLLRWLESRELAKEIAELKKISGGDDLNTAMELCRIFLADCTKEQLELAVYPFEFRKHEAEKLQQYKNLKEQKNEILRAYHGGYEKLLKEIEEKGEEYPFVKSAVAEIYRSYINLYELDAWAFYQRFIKNHPLVILAMLANPNMRPFLAEQLEKIYKDLDIPALLRPRINQAGIDAFLEKIRQNPDQYQAKKIGSSAATMRLKKDKISILVLACHDNPALDSTVINSEELEDSWYPIEYIPVESPSTAPAGYIKTFAGETQGYWKDLQAAGKQFLIIKMEKNNLIRNAGKNGEELDDDSVNGKFLILDGIDYKSNNGSHQLVYMEV